MIDIERMRSRSMDFRSQIVRHETRLPQITNERHRVVERQRIEEYTIAAGARRGGGHFVARGRYLERTARVTDGPLICAATKGKHAHFWQE
jgi:hypothetical protein